MPHSLPVLPVRPSGVPSAPAGAVRVRGGDAHPDLPTLTPTVRRAGGAGPSAPESGGQRFSARPLHSPRHWPRSPLLTGATWALFRP
jgi:hypothetical protein